jgi:hypothetical protein
MAKCREKGREGGAHLRGADARPRRPSPRRLPARQRGVSAQRPAHPAALPARHVGRTGRTACAEGAAALPRVGSAVVGQHGALGTRALHRRQEVGGILRPAAASRAPACLRLQPSGTARAADASRGQVARLRWLPGSPRRFLRGVAAHMAFFRWHGQPHMATARAVARCLLGTRRVPSTLPRNALAARLRPTPVLRARAHASH